MHAPLHCSAYAYSRFIDIGLVWPPSNQLGSGFAKVNRPPTRMHWWWSQGIPTIGFPMVAYVEQAKRVGYPASLLGLHTHNLFDALCAVTPVAARTCLHESALRGGALSHPVYSAYELISALCELGETCDASSKAPRNP